MRYACQSSMTDALQKALTPFVGLPLAQFKSLVVALDEAVSLNIDGFLNWLDLRLALIFLVTAMVLSYTGLVVEKGLAIVRDFSENTRGSCNPLKMRIIQLNTIILTCIINQRDWSAGTNISEWCISVKRPKVAKSWVKIALGSVIALKIGHPEGRFLLCQCLVVWRPPKIEADTTVNPSRALKQKSYLIFAKLLRNHWPQNWPERASNFSGAAWLRKL